MKKKLANILRRFADHISPETAPFVPSFPGPQPPLFNTTGRLQRFQIARHYTRRELMAIEKDPDIVVRIDLDARRELLNALALDMHTAGAITFRTEAEAIPDSHDVLIATCYAAIKNK